MIRSWREAHRLIWGGGLWKYFLIPLGLTVCYWVVLLSCGLYLAGWMSGVIEDWLAYWGWLGSAFAWIVFFFLLIPVFLTLWFTYRSVVMLIYAPFLDRIAERIEVQSGIPPVAGSNFRGDLVRNLVLTVIGFIIGLGFLILNLSVMLIPVAGWALAWFILLPLQSMFSAFNSIDPYLARRRWGIRKSFKSCFSRPFRLMAFGLIGSLIMMIPLIGWFFGPTYVVVAGVIEGRNIEVGHGEGAGQARALRA